MTFGQKKPVEPKNTFYIKESQFGGYFGSINDDKVEVKLLPTGGAQLTIGGKGGQEFSGKPKEGQYGPYHLFIIDGHFWYGNETDTKWGKKYKLKQGPKAEDSADWKAKQAQREGADAAAKLQPSTEDGGTGPAGLSAPQGMPAGVTVKEGSVVMGAATVKPPKPAGYKRPTQG